MHIYFPKLLTNCLCYVTIVLTFLVIWVPVVYHFHVSNEIITDDIIERARTIPDDSVLCEIKSFFASSESWNTKRLVAVSEEIVNGEVTFHGRDSKRITLPFDADEIEDGLSGWQLSMASFEIPKILLLAYEETKRDDFLMTARDVIFGWATYEGNAWLPKGFLWNDHAVAARISVLAKFWKLYRNHPDYDLEVARTIFQMVARSGKLLTKPSHFTFNTNHGVMQNLALLQISLAFPTLPNIDSFTLHAFDRLREQIAFYINDEGVVLEHSAGYHKVGVEFIGMAFRYLTLLNVPIPKEWNIKYENAKDVYAQLRRPDGTLPMFGDTGRGKDRLGPLVTNVDIHGRSGILEHKKNWIPKKANIIYPIAGYSIWWDGLDEWRDEDKLSQCVVVWSNFPGHAHKHADDMSVLLWSGGQTWLTNVGYWTYGTKGRSEALSWQGSNAPHLVGENAKSLRNTVLKFHGNSKQLSVIDLERSGPRRYVARRQIIHIKPKLWVIVDFTTGGRDSKTTTIWTTSSNVELDTNNILNSFNLLGKDSYLQCKTFYLASGGTKVRTFRESLAPFAGWVTNRPASAIVVEQPTNNSWSVAIWHLENTATPSLQCTNQPYMKDWKSPDKWQIVIPTNKGLLSISRDRGVINVNEGFGSNTTKGTKLIKATDITDKHAQIRTGYEDASNKYPKFKPLMDYRWKLTYFLIIVVIVQEVFIGLYTKFHGKHYVDVRKLMIIGWVGIIGVWFFMVSLKA